MHIMLLVVSFSSVSFLEAGLDLLSLSLHFLLHTERAGSFAAFLFSFLFYVLIAWLSLQCSARLILTHDDQLG